MNPSVASNSLAFRYDTTLPTTALTSGAWAVTRYAPLPIEVTRYYTSSLHRLTVVGLAVHRVTASAPDTDKSWVPDLGSRRTEPSFWES
eukprot:8175783-Pyramimonas_sp.AAC.1